MSETCYSCRGPRCQSRRATRDEHGRPYWPTCDLYAGHDGGHRSGHIYDALWVWSDDEAMTPEQVTAWKSGAR